MYLVLKCELQRQWFHLQTPNWTADSTRRLPSGEVVGELPISKIQEFSASLTLGFKVYREIREEYSPIPTSFSLTASISIKDGRTLFRNQP